MLSYLLPRPLPQIPIMKKILFLSAICTALSAAEPVVLLTDDFSRDEATPGKEDIGHGWTSNSAWRAKGHQQVDLKDGVMQVTKHAEADHGVAIFHDVAFQDGIVELRFKLGAGDDLGVDFVDRELKTVHAGHLCMARVTNSIACPWSPSQLSCADTRWSVLGSAMLRRNGDASM